MAARFQYNLAMRASRLAGIILVSAARLLLAQEHGTLGESRRFEFGDKVADIRTSCIGSAHCPIPSFGVGVSGALNLTPHLAIDTDFLKTPQSSTSESNEYGGRASEFLVGVRAEVRARHYGYFLKAQPGYFRWSDAITGVSFLTPERFVFSFGSLTRFVADVGAGAEYSPGGRFHIRGEVTDLMVRYSNNSWTHNLQPTIGVYAGLGNTLRWEPPIYNAKNTHSFWNPSNSTLIAASLLASTADAITTQRAIGHGGHEGDPFARPLVKYGWSGQISLTSIEIGAEVLGMYSLHRMGQHWIERIIPAGVSLTHGILAYNNTKISERRP